MSELKPCEAIEILESIYPSKKQIVTGEYPEVAEALDMAIAALRRAQPENEPLTLEQLREMHGQAVWVVPNGDIAKWYLVDVANDCCSTCDMDVVDFELYGPKDKSYGWLAYRHKPKEEHHEAD